MMLLNKIIIGLSTGGIVVAGMVARMRVLHLSLFAPGLVVFAAGTVLVGWL